MQILFITATRIGDAVISTGLLRHLIDQHPNAKITVACGPLAESLFASVPGLERVIAVPKKKFGGHWFNLWRQVRAQHWDIIVDLRRSLLSYFVSTSERYRLGPDDHVSHRVALLSGLFNLDPPVAPKLWLTEDHQAQARAFLSGDGPVVSLCPIAARPEKTWPMERFVALGEALAASNGPLERARFLLIGAEEDRTAIEGMAANLPAGRCLTLLGNPDLLFVGAVLSQSLVTVANDSGLGHLAAVVECPIVSVFGPTRDDLYRPWGQHVKVVHPSAEAQNRLISDISVDEVLSAVNAILA